MSERVIVAVAGGTCAGKSTLAHLLAEEFHDSASIISQDSFYPDRSDWPESDLELFNWDTIASIDEDELALAITSLAAGRNANVPVYDKPTHSRIDGESLITPARKILVIEGLHVIAITRRTFAVNHPRNAVVVNVFVDCPEPERRSRRMRRDEGLWEDFLGYWFGRAEVIYRDEVLPQRENADIVLASPWANTEINALTDEIRRLL